MPRPKTKPAISVVMPVYNALPHLDEAVESILGQSRHDFEFVIYDDGSTDGSRERLEEWARRDSRIALFRGERNLGPVKSSNTVVGHASAPLIARMDADDVSLPERLERQCELLGGNPDAGVVGCVCEVMDSGGRTVRRLARAPWVLPFPHGSMMVRRALFDRIGGYRQQCEYWEDLDFVIRAAQQSRVLVIAEPLYRWRHSGGGTRMASDQLRVENALDLRYRSVGRIRRGQSYEDLLRGKAGNPDRVDPRVFVSLGLLALWSQRRPRLLGRLLKRGRLKFDAASAIALAWTGWASVSPQSLRLAMKLHSKLRNLRRKRKLGSHGVVEWQPPRAPASAAGTGSGKGPSYVSEAS